MTSAAPVSSLSQAQPKPEPVPPLPPIVILSTLPLTLPAVRPGATSTSAQRPIGMRGHPGGISLTVTGLTGGGTWAGALHVGARVTPLPTSLDVPLTGAGEVQGFLQFSFHAPIKPTTGTATAILEWEREDGSQDGDQFDLHASWTPTAPLQTEGEEGMGEAGHPHHRHHHHHQHQSHASESQLGEEAAK